MKAADQRDNRGLAGTGGADERGDGSGFGLEGDAVENMAVLTMPVRTELSFDLNAGNDTCPLLGNHDGDESKFVIASDPAIGKPPFICDRLPQFVEMRGGEYFFVPSMNALRMMGIGTVDPT